MPLFTRRTILAATDLIAQWSNSQIDRFSLEHGLERIAHGNNRVDRANAIAQFLIQHPDAQNEDGENLTNVLVSQLIQGPLRLSTEDEPPQFSIERFRERYPGIHRGLQRDGFSVDDGELRRALPEALDLPATDDEVHVLLDRYGFAVARGHLDNGVAAHSRGEWAGANGQFRSFFESLLDEIAHRLAGAAALPAPGHQRRQWLANRNPSFFIARLNEWDGQGRGFIEGFIRRLHPDGAHPGLSNEEDSTFRLHLVLLVARNLLRRVP